MSPADLEAVPLPVHDDPTAIMDETGHAHNCDVPGCALSFEKHPCHVGEDCWKRKDEQRIAKLRICASPTVEPPRTESGRLHLVPATGQCVTHGHRWTRWLPIEGDLVEESSTRIAFAYERMCYAPGCTVRQLAQDLAVFGEMMEMAR